MRGHVCGDRQEGKFKLHRLLVMLQLGDVRAHFYVTIRVIEEDGRSVCKRKYRSPAEAKRLCRGRALVAELGLGLLPRLFITASAEFCS